MTRRLAALLTTIAALAVLAVACSADEAGDAGVDDPGADDPVPAAEADAAGSDDVDPEETSYPGDEWERLDATAAGFDPDALGDLVERARDAGSGCLVVARDGRLVVDEAWGPGSPGEPREAFSVTKSFTSVLTGIAQDRGELSLTDPAADHIASWRSTPSDQVTVEDLLANDSGREWSLALDYRELLGAPDKTTFAVELAQAEPPGAVWAYNNSAIQTLAAVLEAATGEPAASYAEEVLFGPIGMADSELSTDPSGGTLTFMGLRTTCQDLARFGHLVLHHGRWDGEQVVSAEYVEAATGAPSTDLAANYGLLFWLNRSGPLVTPTIATTGSTEGSEDDGQMVPGAPEDVCWALGFNNQVMAVLPSEGVVAVRLGPAPPAGQPFSFVELTEGVLEALG